MKNATVFFVFGIIGLGLLFAGCNLSPKEEVQKVVQVTGLTAHTDRYAVIGLGNTAGDTVALSLPALIPARGTVDCALLNANAADNSPWTSGGDYIVVLLITNADASYTYWSGGIIDFVSLDNDTTTLAFDRFTYVAPNLLNSLRGMINE
jgi:hypothetical protein